MAFFISLFKTTSGQSRKSALKNTAEITKRIRLSNSTRSINKTIAYLSDNSVRVGYKVK